MLLLVYGINHGKRKSLVSFRWTLVNLISENQKTQSFGKPTKGEQLTIVPAGKPKETLPEHLAEWSTAYRGACCGMQGEGHFGIIKVVMRCF